MQQKHLINTLFFKNYKYTLTRFAENRIRVYLSFLIRSVAIAKYLSSGCFDVTLRGF